MGIQENVDTHADAIEEVMRTFNRVLLEAAEAGVSVELTSCPVYGGKTLVVRSSGEFVFKFESVDVSQCAARKVVLDPRPTGESP